MPAADGEKPGAKSNAAVGVGRLDGGELKNGSGVPPSGSTSGKIGRVGPARRLLGHPRRKTTTKAATTAESTTASVPVVGPAPPRGVLIRSSSWS